MPAHDIGIEKVSIAPGVSILSVLRHLNYKPWYAIAEFVDNSIQSFLDHREVLAGSEGPCARCRVDIELDALGDGRLVVRDNAAGIRQIDYARAFRPAQLPPDRSGLCEFGMGMKSAACWFSPTWKVRTSALGEPTERSVAFDIARILRDELDELDVEVRPAPADRHYTEIILEGLHNKPQKRTIAKIRDHLGSIYRVFLRDQTLRLTLNGEELSYTEPEVLVAPRAGRSGGDPFEWRKQIDFDLGGGLTVHGFAAIRKVASTSGAGFSLFRRNRVIEGSGDETYRPEFIFGKPNTFVYQRLFGELQLEGFDISHTKDGFRWEADEEPFFKLLREHLDEEPLPLLRQAREHRSHPDRGILGKGASVAFQRTVTTLERELAPVMERQLHGEPFEAPPPARLPEARSLAVREMAVEFDDCLWQIRIDLSCDPAVSEWVSISSQPGPANLLENIASRSIGIRISLEHPFMMMFGGVDADSIEPLLRVAVAICLAEVTTRESKGNAGTFRRNINDLLRNVLADPAPE